MSNQQEQYEDYISTVPPDQTVAIIIPLYGYWKDVTAPELNLDVLKYVLSRIKSYHNKTYFLFPCETQRLSPEIKNYLLGLQLGGNALGVDVEQYSTYSDYINEGILFALEETDSQVLLIINPWIAVKPGSIDKMIQTLNRPDVAICSGFDLRKDGVTDDEADTYVYNPPQDLVGLDLNFVGMKRQVAEMIKIDTTYKTPSFLSRDFFEEAARAHIPALLTQHLLFYSFEVSWSELEDPGDFDYDHSRFLEKWRFEPEIKEDER